MDRWASNAECCQDLALVYWNASHHGFILMLGALDHCCLDGCVPTRALTHSLPHSSFLQGGSDTLGNAMCRQCIQCFCKCGLPQVHHVLGVRDALHASHLEGSKTPSLQRGLGCDATAPLAALRSHLYVGSLVDCSCIRCLTFVTAPQPPGPSIDLRRCDACIRVHSHVCHVEYL